MFPRGEQWKYAKNSNLNIFESALYSTSVSMPLRDLTLPAGKFLLTTPAIHIVTYRHDVLRIFHFVGNDVHQIHIFPLCKYNRYGYKSICTNSQARLFLHVLLCQPLSLLYLSFLLIYQTGILRKLCSGNLHMVIMSSFFWLYFFLFYIHL